MRISPAVVGLWTPGQLGLRRALGLEASLSGLTSQRLWTWKFGQSVDRGVCSVWNSFGASWKSSRSKFQLKVARAQEAAEVTRDKLDSWKSLGNGTVRRAHGVSS